ncbi:MAG TPA: acylphosphatase [Stellaceae bacterium]|nr:acylphosphatase [Stellaceae bacterium]
MAVIAARLVITGRVQGVGYRLWAKREARRRSLRGWVRNLSNGSVEALVIGEAAEVDAFVEACRSGPSMARVDAIQREATADDGTRGFEERPTL